MSASQTWAPAPACAMKAHRRRQLRSVYGATALSVQHKPQCLSIDTIYSSDYRYFTGMRYPSAPSTALHQTHWTRSWPSWEI